MTSPKIPLAIVISLGFALPTLGCGGGDEKAGADGQTADKSGQKPGPDGGGSGEAKASGKKILAIDVASLSTCALLEGGTVRCWGANLEGQLGVGKDAEELLESYTPLDVPGISGATKLWTGESYSWSGSHSEGTTDTACVQLADGAISCWGHNGKVFGDGESKNQPAPTAIAALAGITELDSASGHACAVWPDKTAKCWGSNAFGVLGIGNDERDVKAPTPVKDLSGVVDLSCGQNHCCGLKEDGSASCWGYGSSGQLGDGGRDKQNAPVPVVGLSDATQLSVYGSTSCVLKKDGTVACWGSDFGKEPKLVDGATDIVQLDTEGFGCGRKSDKTVVCWGANSYGQLGDGTNEDRKSTAAPVKGLAGVAQIAVGTRHACALLEDNSVKCWGKNGRGQLGDGTIEDRLEPVTVVQVGDETLAPLADLPDALPTDGKVAELSGAPDGCTLAFEAKVEGATIPFVIRHVEAAWNSSELGIKLNFLNYDIDPDNKWAMPRGRQARIGFALEKWVIELNEEGKERPVQKPVDTDAEFTTKMLDSYRLTNSAGIFDNHKQRFFDTGSVKVTHLDDSWVCGEINLSHAEHGHALTGTFAAQLPAKKSAN